MLTVLMTPLRRLAGAVGGLWAKARAAVGRLATAAGRLLAEAAEAVLADDADRPPYAHTPRPYPADGPTPRDDPDRWDDRGDLDDGYAVDGYGRAPYESSTPPVPASRPAATGAVAAGAAAARWWVRRKGSAWGAAGVGLLTALAVLAGGPVARVAAALAGLAEM